MIKNLEAEYDQKRKETMETKEKHLRMFRPNLENPANKQATANLNAAETKRSDLMKDVSYFGFN